MKNIYWLLSAHIEKNLLSYKLRKLALARVSLASFKEELLPTFFCHLFCRMESSTQLYSGLCIKCNQIPLLNHFSRFRSEIEQDA